MQVGPLGRLGSRLAHTLGTLVWAVGASSPGPFCLFRWDFPVYASPFWDIVNAWSYAGFKQNTRDRGIVFKGKSFGEVPMQSSNFGIPRKWKQLCPPILCSSIRKFLVIPYFCSVWPHNIVYLSTYFAWSMKMLCVIAALCGNQLERHRDITIHKEPASSSADLKIMHMGLHASAKDKEYKSWSQGVFEKHTRFGPEWGPSGKLLCSVRATGW